MKVGLKDIINTLVWWMAGALFTYGFIVFSPQVANDPQVTWAGRLLLLGIMLPLWPVALGAIVVGLVMG